MLSEEEKKMPVKSFRDTPAWEAWLKKNHTRAKGIWIRLFKKASGKATITYAEALDVCLCYGWIDGRAEKLDEISWIQKYTPRGKRSVWSKRNIEHVTRLSREGRMQASGRAAVEAARADGRWTRAYDSPSKMAIPDDLVRALRRKKGAYAFFKTLNKANRYAIGWRLQTAKKPETRARRMKMIVEMMAAGKRFH